MRRFAIALVAAAAFGVAGAQTATAADIPAKAPAYKAPVAVAYDWTGFYAGVLVGGGWGDHDRVTSTGFANTYDSSGFLIGGVLGYNWQFNRWVLGIETDLSYTSISGDDAGVGGTVDETELNWLGSLRVRGGYAFNNWLVFATFGLAYGGFDHTNFGPPIDSFSSTETGWTVGAGIEYAFNNRWSARLDYRYYDLGSYDRPAPTNGIVPYSVDNTFSTVTFGLSYKFYPGGW